MCVREREFLVEIPPVCAMYEQNEKGTKGTVLQVKGCVVPLLSCEGPVVFLEVASDVASNTVVT